MKQSTILIILLVVAAHAGCGKSTMWTSSATGAQEKRLAARPHSHPASSLSSSVPHGPTWKRLGGVYHKVKPGETLWRICKTYGVDMQDVAEINNITDPGTIRVGIKVFIPGAKRVLKVDPKRVFGSEPDQKISFPKGKFQWPVRGEISSGFGVQDKKMHNGINIRAFKGQHVQAAQSGVVFYAGSLRGYGKIVVIQHAGNYSTVYAHLGHVSVKKGHPVKKGDSIGRVGESSNSTGPHLHFEVRLRGKPRNPMFYLP